MSTLLLRLAAPLQSWGLDAKFDRRGTERAPTKSGMIGLLGAAMGMRRDESFDDLQKLRFGVRIDKEGTLLRDYHIAKSERSAYVTQRYYLSDAVFLAGLEGDEELLVRIEHALKHPVFPLSLGRRSCPPEGKLVLGIRSGKDLIGALKEEPWLAYGWQSRQAGRATHLHLVLDAEGSDDDAYFRRDVPLSFNQTHRRYGFRRIIEMDMPLVFKVDTARAADETVSGHDPMLELEG